MSRAITIEVPPEWREAWLYDCRMLPPAPRVSIWRRMMELLTW